MFVYVTFPYANSQMQENIHFLPYANTIDLGSVCVFTKSGLILNFLVPNLECA